MSEKENILNNTAGGSPAEEDKQEEKEQEKEKQEKPAKKKSEEAGSSPPPKRMRVDDPDCGELVRLLVELDVQQAELELSASGCDSGNLGGAGGSNSNKTQLESQEKEHYMFGDTVYFIVTWKGSQLGKPCLLIKHVHDKLLIDFITSLKLQD
ncbi:uncharacterized protein LOC6614945 [Drosophila sechellia]|uniref:uncharacterized protein LOC6614945 n=1 Tax=Drosophila sechellia TaxID=7238 RepID=UPI0013DDB0B1|nr:uncharacterized protein LOC6614945 [Drosophila sechellia]